MVYFSSYHIRRRTSFYFIINANIRYELAISLRAESKVKQTSFKVQSIHFFTFSITPIRFRSAVLEFVKFLELNLQNSMKHIKFSLPFKHYK